MELKPHAGKDLPMFEETMRKFENLEFMRDRKDATVLVGWYQNLSGELFHYDGSIWDNVPGERVQELEFLGGNETKRGS